MLSELSCRNVVVLVGCVCVPVVTAYSEQLAADAPKSFKGESQRGWVLEAERLVAELGDLARETPRKEEYSWSLKGTLVANQRTADRLLWRLWLVTGMPLLLQKQDEAFDGYFRRNAFAYQDYVAKHNDLTLQEVCRLGLDNAVESAGSPLWYMTLRYLIEKAGVDSRWNVVVNTTPRRLLTVLPVREGGSKRRFGALAQWLKDNKEKLEWDADAKRFRPQNGKCVGTDELVQSLVHFESAGSSSHTK